MEVNLPLTLMEINLRWKTGPCWFIHIQAQGLSKRDEYAACKEYGHLFSTDDVPSFSE